MRRSFNALTLFKSTFHIEKPKPLSDKMSELKRIEKTEQTGYLQLAGKYGQSVGNFYDAEEARCRYIKAILDVHEQEQEESPSRSLKN